MLYFDGDEGRFGSITRSATLYSTTRGVLRRSKIRAEEAVSNKAGVGAFAEQTTGLAQVSADPPLKGEGAKKMS